MSELVQIIVSDEKSAEALQNFLTSEVVAGMLQNATGGQIIAVAVIKEKEVMENPYAENLYTEDRTSGENPSEE